MKFLSNLKNLPIRYFNYIKSDKSEILYLIFSGILTIILAKKFIGGYSSSGGFDIPAEFNACLVISNVILLISIALFSGNNPLKRLSFISLIASLLSFLTLKSLASSILVKLGLIYLSIFLFIYIITTIGNREIKVSK